MKRINCQLVWNIITIMLLIFPFSAFADNEVKELRHEIALIKKQINTLEKQPTLNQEKSSDSSNSHLTSEGKKFMDNYPDVSSANAPFSTESKSGYGYSLYGAHSSDLSAILGGYGILSFVAPKNSSSSFNASIYPNIILRYKDKFEWNSLLWFYVDQNGATQTSLIFTYVDWFVRKHITLEGGKYLSPLGKFERDFYLPWLNKMPSRPVGFNSGGAAPIADIGIQIKGDIPSTTLNYAAFIANGPRANVVNGQIHDIGSAGYSSDLDGHKVLGGRLAFFPFSVLEVGASAATGKVGLFNSSNVMIESSRKYYSLGTDVTYNWNNLNLRGEYIKQQISRLDTSTLRSAKRWSAWYVQGAYKFLEPFEGVVRYGYFSSPSVDQKQRQLAFSLNYYFSPTIVAFLSYEFNHGRVRLNTNSNRVLAQFSMGVM